MTETLERHDIPYQVTGGLAGNVHGSRWPLHDLDLDVRTADLPRLAALFAPAVVWGPGRYVDAEFDLPLLRLNVDGVEVDFSGAEDAWARRNGKRLPLVTDLARAERRVFAGVNLWVVPLADLITYKTVLGRTADLEELSRLNGAGRGKDR
ncbi:nucleotidyltransferase domain-containing protein [Deinococcus aetherius]|uniref:nucleotidyltransferase domain-containing protein n=1 Tax=Deinococcus aetherius TaxID=200252 RepID=UPI0022314593|nr:hypothetical protein [Deinococcus aetherius]